MSDTDWEFSHINPLVMFLISWAVSLVVLFPLAALYKYVRRKAPEPEERKGLKCQPIDVEAVPVSVGPSASAADGGKNVAAFKSFANSNFDDDVKVDVGHDVKTHPDAVAYERAVAGPAGSSSGGTPVGGFVSAAGSDGFGDGISVAPTIKRVDEAGRKKRWADMKGDAGQKRIVYSKSRIHEDDAAFFIPSEEARELAKVRRQESKASRSASSGSGGATSSAGGSSAVIAANRSKE